MAEATTFKHISQPTRSVSREALKAFLKQGKYPLSKELRMEFHPDFPDFSELEEDTSLLDLEMLSKETGLHLRF